MRVIVKSELIVGNTYLKSESERTIKVNSGKIDMEAIFRAEPMGLSLSKSANTYNLYLGMW